MPQMHDQTTVVRKADDDRITETVIFAVAEARGVPPEELETPLYGAIDGEALERFLSDHSDRSALAATCVEFTWAGCDVAVHGTGRVVVTQPADG